MASPSLPRISHIFSLFVTFMLTTGIPARAQLLGSWELLVPDSGIASMHTIVTRFNTVVLLDRTWKENNDRMLRRGQCSGGAPDCYAHSAVFDPRTTAVRPLTILTNTMCSSGGFLPDGTLLQTGGENEGLKKIRTFVPCEPTGSCDWKEVTDTELANDRWYATNQILPDGTFIIIGGRNVNTVEYYPPRDKGSVEFPFLAETNDGQPDNMYPYVHLLPNGHLFVFANDRAVMYDHQTNTVVKNYPPLEGGPRNYPSAGSSAMLALRGGNNATAEILVCGGAQKGAYNENDTDAPAQRTCGRIVATSPEPSWHLEVMPFRRIMGDMVLLPTGDVLIINGAQAGTQNLNMARQPCLHPVLYRPDQPISSRFITLKPGTVPRMYHSTANLLPDGRVLLAGSNPWDNYSFNAEFPTELRIEAFSPGYLSPDKANLRPAIEEVADTVRYGESFDVVVSVSLPVESVVEVNMGSAPFATHSFSQGQRLVKLPVGPAVREADGRYRIRCTAPPGGSVAPPGYYMTFAVNQGVPSVARWVHLIN